EPFRIARFTWEYILPSNTGLPYGIEDLQGVNALMPREYGDLFRAIHPDLNPDGRRITPFFSAAQVALPIWDLLGVRAFLLSPSLYRPGSGAEEAERFLLEEIGGFQTVSREPFTRLENTDALPRAFLRHAYRIEEDRGRILREVTSPLFDPAGPLWIEEHPGIESLESAVLPGDECAIVGREGSALRVRTRSDRPALLFVSETFYPGWEALVDGTKSRVLRADYAFRAVALPEGEHEAVFRYRPRSFRNGLIGSGLFLLVYLAVLLAPRRRGPCGPARDLSR
ncbi:MAG: YfhO family protein, partial [Candidatus Eisenbacteria bacterium]